MVHLSIHSSCLLLDPHGQCSVPGFQSRQKKCGTFSYPSLWTHHLSCGNYSTPSSLSVIMQELGTSSSSMARRRWTMTRSSGEVQDSFCRWCWKHWTGWRFRFGSAVEPVLVRTNVMQHNVIQFRQYQQQGWWWQEANYRCWVTVNSLYCMSLSMSMHLSVLVCACVYGISLVVFRIYFRVSIYKLCWVTMNSLYCMSLSMSMYLSVLICTSMYGLSPVVFRIYFRVSIYKFSWIASLLGTYTDYRPTACKTAIINWILIEIYFWHELRQVCLGQGTFVSATPSLAVWT